MDREGGEASNGHPNDSVATQEHSGPQLPLWCSLLLVGGTFAALAVWSWGKWTDAHIDFGAELYIPWRITEGDVLYRDIAYRHGPLSHNANAVFFTLFGVSLRTLIFCNLAILIALCGLIGKIFEGAFDRNLATVTVIAFLAIFGFSQYVGISNFNYVTPYLHAQTHGLLLSLATLASILAALRGGGAAYLVLAGLCFGGVLLTKAEIAVPAAASALFGLWLIPTQTRRTGPHPAAASKSVVVLGRLSIFGAAALVPGLVFYGYFRSEMPADLALAGVLGNWHALGASVLDDPYYRRGAGFDDVLGNSRRMLEIFAGICLAAIGTAAADRLVRSWRNPTWIATAVGAACFAVLVARPSLVPWRELARALPLTSFVAGAIAVALCLRHRSDERRIRKLAPIALWSIFALGLLGKMVLYSRFSHYGFVLAMPATLLLIACAIAWIPGWLHGRYGGGAFFRGVASACVAALIVFQLAESNRHYEIKNFVFESGADSMLLEDPRIQNRGRVLTDALASLRATMPPEATLLVLPDGVGLNYWLKRRNPSRFTLFLPPEFEDLGGEATILRDLARDRPDFIALIHRNHMEFGVGPFGQDPANGRRIMQWVESNYRRMERFGAEPFQGRGFGVVLLRSRDESASAPSPSSAETLR